MDAARPWLHDKRSSSERGYGWAWQKLRLRILARDGYICQCEECTKANRIRPAQEVDHIVSKAEWKRRHLTLDGVDNPSNLQAINRLCHERKSLAERGYTEPQRIGEDGFPVA